MSITYHQSWNQLKNNHCVLKKLSVAFSAHFTSIRMNRGRPKHHVKAAFFKYVKKDGQVEIYAMKTGALLKAESEQVDSFVNNEAEAEKKAEKQNIVEINKPDQRKNRNTNLIVRTQNISQIRNLQQLLSFYQGTPNDLFTELYRYLSKNNPGWLVNFLQNNNNPSLGIDFSYQNNPNQSLLAVSEDLCNQNFFQGEYNDQFFLKTKKHEMNEFEDAQSIDGIDLLKLELASINNPQFEYQEIESNNSYLEISNLYL